MGYRSDVKLITTKEGWERLQEVERVSLPPDSAPYTDDENMCLLMNQYVLLELESVKWNDTFDSQVQAIMATLDSFDQQGIPYQFMRLGEDWEDVEYRFYHSSQSKHSDMPELGLKREIEVEY